MKPGWIVAAIVVLALAGAGGAVYMGTRGIRNNNPGNIRKSKEPWLGMAEQQTDKDFIQFVKPEYGVRALVKVLRTYIEKHGLRSPTSIISRWAPPTENDTTSYIESVTKQTGFQPFEMLRSEPEIMFKLAKAIINHENGTLVVKQSGKYPDEVIKRGVQMAFS